MSRHKRKQQRAKAEAVAKELQATDSFQARTQFPRWLWGSLLIVALLVFLLGFFTGQISLAIMAFLLTGLVEVMGRKGMLRGFADSPLKKNAGPRITQEQRLEIVEELRAQRKEKKDQKRAASAQNH